MVDRHDLTLSGLEPPTWCHDLLKQFGQTPWGEDIFRVVWAPRRITMYGGYWNDTGMFEYRMVPRYGKLKAFVMERWIPARHFGGPKAWAQATANPEGYLSNGPWPRYGVYISFSNFTAPDRSYIPILPDLVLLTAQACYAGRVRRTWDIRDAILSEEAALESMSEYEFEKKWDETHGVRRGSSFSKDGVIQNNDAEIEAYTQKLAASPIKMYKDEFKPGFRQGEV